jgi:trans-aconitate 2-methyltransferase
MRTEPEHDVDRWDPGRYERFGAERDRPVDDLLGLVEPVPGGRVVDLGCGTGRHTVRLHQRTGAGETLGIDSSPRMLALSEGLAGDGLHFTVGDLREVPSPEGGWDVVFANASLQWVPDHERLLPTLVAGLAPGGQLAFQVPANFDHPSHTVADEVGAELGLEPLDRAIGASTPGRYAETLWASGLRDLDVTLRVYGVAMERTEAVIEWVSGTLLTRFEAALDDQGFREFRRRYRERLLDALGDPSGARPYYYAFPRILCWGRRPSELSGS